MSSVAVENSDVGELVQRFVESDAMRTRKPRWFQESLGILLVDDDERSLETMAFFLGVDGHEVYTATSGCGAVDVVRQLKRKNVRVDLSILDYHMPDLTGTDTFIRLTAELPALEAIFVSGESSTAVRRGVHRVGGRALLEKPIDVVTMRRALEEFWKERGGNHLTR